MESDSHKETTSTLESLYGFLKVLFLYTAVFYFIFNPANFAVFVLEYFKIPPVICFSIIAIGFPVAVATIAAHFVAKIISLRWNHFARKFIHDFLLILLALFIIPVLFILFVEYIAGKRAIKNKIVAFVEKRRQHRKDFREKSHEHIRSDVYADIYFAIFFGVLVVLFASYTFRNGISNRWLPENNKFYEATAYTHYYCQTRHNYSKEECEYWDDILNDVESERGKNIKEPISAP